MRFSDWCVVGRLGTVLFTIAVGITGCQGPSIFGGGTGVLPVGPDTYTITENAILSFGGSVTAQEKATRAHLSMPLGK
jgi:hypothetical protein